MSEAFAGRANRTVRLLWFTELLVLVLAVSAAVWLRYINDVEQRIFFALHSPLRSFLVALFITAAMAAFGLYQPHVRHNRVDFILRVGLAFALGGVGLFVLYYLVPQAYIGRGVLAISLCLGFMVVCGLRLGVYSLLGFQVFKKRILFYGAGENADLINKRLRRSSDRTSFTVVGFVPLANQPIVVDPDLLIGNDASLSELASRLNVHEIVIAPDERRGGLPMDDILLCAQRGLSVVVLPGVFER